MAQVDTSAPKRTFQYKIVLLGDSGVGKTNLITQFVKGEFSELLNSTIGVAFFSHTIRIQEFLIKFEIWDTAGQERYATLAPLYYRGAHAAIVVYDITQAKSLDRAKAWIKELQQQTDLELCIMLAGNKADLVGSLRAVDEKEAGKYASDAKMLFIECSAKTGANVKELFVAIANSLLSKSTFSEHAAEETSNSLLSQPPAAEKKCCT